MAYHMLQVVCTSAIAMAVLFVLPLRQVFLKVAAARPLARTHTHAQHGADMWHSVQHVVRVCGTLSACSTPCVCGPSFVHTPHLVNTRAPTKSHAWSNTMDLISPGRVHTPRPCGACSDVAAAMPRGLYRSGCPVLASGCACVHLMHAVAGGQRVPPAPWWSTTGCLTCMGSWLAAGIDVSDGSSCYKEQTHNV
jgi:hypothetical protein